MVCDGLSFALRHENWGGKHARDARKSPGGAVLPVFLLSLRALFLCAFPNVQTIPFYLVTSFIAFCMVLLPCRCAGLRLFCIPCSMLLCRSVASNLGCCWHFFACLWHSGLWERASYLNSSIRRGRKK
ncbi:hypothetical protein, unlikely [Trypanosoma brucei gambiense DAL972]|uniref:Uncharacterized protein n=1 Tax=Trypanosoma brucei gambiense (strain MHOM/CI/86/DAL972) TaxID=679716 RepID=D0A966_TRYB9|nr:hypothetical protein, unlikely [Trypanosoma brucei gambiense DAL972]CBH18217.1 hypothetical protein, unlikely [Trypanosoma brucei gambiense DAL972]|eukprot:XP_011780481.1 hypothetical protein, unlikely [Trypanosoma brucei gambiense DAL972]